MSEPQRISADAETVVSTADARQGKSGLGVRYVLAISTLGAVAVMGVVYIFFFTT